MDEISISFVAVDRSGPPDEAIRAAGPCPRRHSQDAAGFDLCAWIESPRVLQPGERALIACGFCMELPAGYEAQVRPRSGLALKHGVTLLNAPGTIDADYRGEVGAILINHGQEPFVVEPGMRVAQLVVSRLLDVNFVATDRLRSSQRGEGGFGSTGLEIARVRAEATT